MSHLNPAEFKIYGMSVQDVHLQNRYFFRHVQKKYYIVFFVFTLMFLIFRYSIISQQTMDARNNKEDKERNMEFLYPELETSFGKTVLSSSHSTMLNPK